MNFSKLYYEYATRVIKESSVNTDFTHRCRLECPFCQRQRPTGKPKVKRSKDMSVSDFRKLISSVQMIHLCGQIGDPIYNRNFHECLEIKSTEYPKKRLGIHTNGSGKSMDWWKKTYELSDAKTYITFGLDGLDQETLNTYRVNSNFDEVWNAILLGKKMAVDVRWQFIVFGHNEHQLEDAKKLAKEHSITFNLIKSSRWPTYNKDKIKKPSNKMWAPGGSDNTYEVYMNDDYLKSRITKTKQ